MRRPSGDHFQLGGQDSFIDVVTNLVGVLIILVVVIGLKNKPEPVDPTVAITEEVTAELAGLQSQSQAVEVDMNRTLEQMQSLRRELAARSYERDQVALLVALAEKELAARRGRLSVEEQQQLDLRQQVLAAQTDIERQQSAAAQVENSKAPTVEVKSYPTPLSKTVLGREMHFQLSAGRIAYVPFEELFDDAKRETRGASSIAELTDKVNIVGPRRGFELRFILQASVDRGTVSVRSEEFKIIPVQTLLGERIDEALIDESQFRRDLVRASTRDTTVTLWTYPDSFGEYRKVNEELHRLGYATAGRPLPTGYPIGGSPTGSKSAAQ